MGNEVIYKKGAFYGKQILTLKAPRKMHLKMLAAEVVCCKTLLANLSIQAKSVDPEQTAPIGAV